VVMGSSYMFTDAVSGEPIALVYDVHGNLAALEAVLEETKREGVTQYVFGGDYASFGPWPRETAELLDTLRASIRIRGNVERWLREEPDVPPAAHDLVTAAMNAARESLGPEWIARLYDLPVRAELDGILVCHGSPLSDVESFAPQAQADEARMLAGERDRTILFGHSHVQFRRPGPDGTLLVNPGSAGMPLDGDPRVAWALYQGGEIEFRRTQYDIDRAVAQMRTWGDWTAPIVHRLQHGSDA
jgi:predicted phosphodiesterase